MSEGDRPQTEFHADRYPEHEQRESGDDAGENKWQKHEPAKERFAGKRYAIERKRRGSADEQSDQHGTGSDDQAVENGVPHGGVGKELAIPIESESGGRKAADSWAIEGVENQNRDRKIEERKDRGHVQLEP